MSAIKHFSSVTHGKLLLRYFRPNLHAATEMHMVQRYYIIRQQLAPNIKLLTNACTHAHSKVCIVTRAHKNAQEEEEHVTRPICPYKIVYRAENMKCTIFRTSAQGSHVPTVIDRNAQV